MTNAVLLVIHQIQQHRYRLVQSLHWIAIKKRTHILRTVRRRGEGYLNSTDRDRLVYCQWTGKIHSTEHKLGTKQNEGKMFPRRILRQSGGSPRCTSISVAVRPNFFGARRGRRRRDREVVGEGKGRSPFIGLTFFVRRVDMVERDVVR